MKQAAQLAVRENYSFIRATEDQIVEFLTMQSWAERVKIAEEEIRRSFREGGYALKAWLHMTAKGMTNFPAERYSNLVPSQLRNSLATLISGTTVTPTFKANYFALGTGSAAPANSDMMLQSETLRAQFTNRFAESNVAYLNVYFGNAQVGGNTYLEAGIFVDGSGSANSGYLLSHAAINQAIGPNETLTVNCSITIN
jgi:hypothetical protein